MLPINISDKRDELKVVKEEEIKAQKIEQLTTILRETERNLTACEDILRSYLQKRVETIQTISEKTLSETSDVERLATEIIQSDQNSSILLDEDGNPRDRRALGVLLQGLVQAFGYNTTPVQLASLPNPNTIGTMASGPVSIDVRQARPPITTAAPRPIVPPPPPPPPPPPLLPPAPRTPAAAPVPAPATSVPRQRETLRFTGVVNFGNNSDILGHLRQYERLFHGPTSTTGRPPAPAPAPAPAPTPAPAINPRNVQTRPPLLEPFFVPIPIPLSPNIQNLQDLQYPMTPRVSIVTPNTVTTVVTPVEYTSPPTAVKQEYVSEEHKEITTVKSQKTSGNRNPNFDERRNNHKKIVQNNKIREEKIVQKNQKAPANLEDSHEEDAGEGHDDNLQKDEDTDAGEDDEKAAEIDSDEESEEEGSKLSDAEDQGGEIEGEDTKTEQQTDQSDSSENESEPEQEYNEEENDSEEEPSPSQKYSSNASIDANKSKKVSLEDAEDYIPQKFPDDYAMKLPVEDKPFQGPFMNSYGQSLEHAGRIDESVADYFHRYKNAQSGLFDAQSIIAPQIQKRPLWIEGVPRHPIERIHNDYRQLLPRKLERYNLNSNHNLNVNNRKGQGAEGSEDDQRVGVMNRISKTYKKPPRDKIQEGESRVEDQKKLEKPNAGKFQKIQSEPLQLVPFDFTKYIPYYKPVQYFFSPESLQRTTQSILAHRNSQNYRNSPETGDTRDTQKELEENPSVTAPVDKSAQIIRIPEKLMGRQPHQGQNEGVKHRRIIQQMRDTAGKTEIIKNHSSTELPLRHPEDSDNSSERYSDDSPESNDENLNTTDETPIPRYPHSGRSSSQEVIGHNTEPKTAEPIKQSHHYEIIHHPSYPHHDPESVQDYSDDTGRQESAGKQYQSSEEASASREDSPEERYVDEEPKSPQRILQIKYVSVSPEENQESTGQIRYQESLPQENYGRNEPKPMDKPPVTSNLEDESGVRNPEEDFHRQGSSLDIKTIRNLHGLPAKSIDDDKRFLVPQDRVIRYRFRYGPETGPSDEVRVHPQYAPYSEPSALYSTYPNNDQTISSVGHFIFGQKIDPSLEVPRGEGRDPQTKILESSNHMNSRILKTEMTRPIIRQPITVSESPARGREFKSANSEGYRGYIVSDKSRGGDAFKSRGLHSNYPRYHSS